MNVAVNQRGKKAAAMTALRPNSNYNSYATGSSFPTDGEASASSAVFADGGGRAVAFQPARNDAIAVMKHRVSTTIWMGS